MKKESDEMQCTECNYSPNSHKDCKVCPFGGEK